MSKEEKEIMDTELSDTPEETTAGVGKDCLLSVPVSIDTAGL